MLIVLFFMPFSIFEYFYNKKVGKSRSIYITIRDIKECYKSDERRRGVSPGKGHRSSLDGKQTVIPLCFFLMEGRNAVVCGRRYLGWIQLGWPSVRDHTVALP